MKLAKHMASVATTYNSDKLFGKLIIQLIKICKKDKKDIIEQLKYVSSDHKSVWKVQIEKLLKSF